MKYKYKKHTEKCSPFNWYVFGSNRVGMATCTDCGLEDGLDYFLNRWKEAIEKQLNVKIDN